MKTVAIIAISVGVFFVGIGISYAIFSNTYNPSTLKFTNQEIFDQMISQNPKMVANWMETMMQDEQFHNQAMDYMVKNPEQMNQWMVHDPKHVEEMATAMKENHDFMMEMMSVMMNDPALRLQMLGHMTENPESMEMMEKMMGQSMMGSEMMSGSMMDSGGEKIVEKEINFDKIYLEVTGIHELARMSDVAQALSVSNNEFSAMPDAFSVIEQRENEWTTTDWEVITPFMHELIENNVSDLLREHANNYPSSIGVEYDMYPEIILTNSFGVNIAQTGKTTDYLQSDELWWIRAKADLLYISEIHYDQSADVYSVDIGFRVSDDRGQFLGVIKAVTNVDQLYKP